MASLKHLTSLILKSKNPTSLSLFFSTPKPFTMSWSCSKCTFLNPPTQKSTCQVCLSTSLSSTPPSPSPPSSSSQPTATWSCKACTFINPFGTSECKICNTRSSASLISDFERLDSISSNDDVDSLTGDVFFPLKVSKDESFSGLSQVGVPSLKACTRESEKRRGFESPLRSCKRKNQDSVSSDGLNELGNLRAAKAMKKNETLLGKSPLQPCKTKNDTTSETESIGEFGKLPLQPCKRKNPDTATDSASSDGFRELSKFRSTKTTEKDDCLLDDSSPNAGFSTIKILTYNVWFREDLEMYKRMQALGDLIQQYSPDVICFQEVTPNIYGIFQQSSWWKAYCCSVSTETSMLSPYFCMQLSKLPVKSFSCKPFGNSIMGRELCMTEVDVKEGKTLVVATSHLESPCIGPPTWDQTFSKERIAQAEEAVTSLSSSPNVVFGGDMNWDDKSDGKFPISDGWVDAWAVLKPREDGYTYDTKSNQMLSGNRKLQKRLDRFFCKLQDYKISGIEMIGMEAIPGVSYCKEKKMKNEIKKMVLPVLPSDHYGLLLTICRK